MKKLILIFLIMLPLSCKRVDKSIDIVVEVNYSGNLTEVMYIEHSRTVHPSSRGFLYLKEGCLYYGFDYRRPVVAACQVRTFKVIKGGEQIDLR